jgi:acyl-CoA dehydrogenase
MVAKFVAQEINPQAEEWNEAGELPREIWLRMGELGLLGTAYEEKYGGSDSDFLYSIILAEELTRSRCSGLNMSVCVHKDMSSSYILAGSEELRMKHIPKCITGKAICAIAVTEPGGGSDVSAIKTKAVREGDYYVLNGQKTFITNGNKADLAIAAVCTDPKASPSHRGISLLVVEDGTPGFTKGAKLKKMGTLASDTAELYFQDCQVPVGNLLGEENGGFKIIMERFSLERLIASAMYVTACQEMLKLTTDYCRTRKAFGQTISSFQANKHQLVEMYTETEIAKVFFYDCCRRYMKGIKTNKEISMIKYFASELANRIAYNCVSLHGGYGYMKEYPICQWYTDVRLFPIGAGTTQIMKEVIAKEIGL